MTRTPAKTIFATMIAIMLAAGFFAAPQPAAAGCCVVGTTTTTDFCDATHTCPAGTGGSATAATCDLAQTACVAGTPTAGGTGGTGGTGGSGSQSGGSLINPLENVCKSGTSGQQCLQLVIGNVIKGALGLTGSIALLMIIWGGFLWLTSMGNNERVEKGRNVLIWATIGLALIFGAYGVTSYVIEKLILGQ